MLGLPKSLYGPNWKKIPTRYKEHICRHDSNLQCIFLTINTLIHELKSSRAISHVNIEFITNIPELSPFSETLLFNLTPTQLITQGDFSTFPAKASNLKNVIK
jgi:hypothetical protein